MTDARTAQGNVSMVIAACIVAAGLIGAALIVAHKPVAVAPVSAKPVALPPITQESARDQFRAQALASPKLHSWTYKKVSYTLQDVQLAPDDVSYSAKDDAFTMTYHYVILPPPPADISSSDYTILTNDGYNHYSGFVTVDPGPGVPNIVSDTVTIK